MELARWKQFSTKQHLGHITSELNRAKNWEDKNDLVSRNNALERALDLANLTVACYTGTRRREFARFREIIAHCLSQSNTYRISLSDIQRYGLQHIIH